MAEENQASPFLRWAGGKKWLTKYLMQIIGEQRFNNYHEPFLGGGAIFFAVNPSQNVYLSDANVELIQTYKVVRDKPQKVINKLLKYINTEEEYYQVRSTDGRGEIERAARFIYLNQTSYNGLYRVNRSGKYNVPYGFRKNVQVDPKKILAASTALQKVDIKHGDFTVNLESIREGDLVFLDPPYTVSHNNNGFIEYNRNLFSLDDQQRLSDFIDIIKRRNAYYILTNAAHEVIREIFFKENDRMLELNRNSLIGGKNSERKLITEYIFTNIASGVK